MTYFYPDNSYFNIFQDGRADAIALTGRTVWLIAAEGSSYIAQPLTTETYVNFFPQSEYL